MSKSSKQAFLEFLVLCASGFIASVGSGITSFGLSIYVFEKTGLATATMLITLPAFLPALLISPLAGVWADRYDRRFLMILGNGLSAIGLVYMLFCMLLGEVQLWQIGTGVAIRSVLSSLIDPAFQATITDLLKEEEYTKASGFVQLSGSAKVLVSPLIAGYLLVVSDIRLLLVIDVCTIFIAVITIVTVRKGIALKKCESKESVLDGFRTGWTALTENRGVFMLAAIGACTTFFMTFTQSLSTPMILAFTDSSVLGVTTAICAVGMLVSSVLLSLIPIRKGFVKTLFVTLFFAGIFMAGFGLSESILIICMFGFLFFAMLPFANMSIDYLIRTNIQKEVQGRVWGLIGIIFQLGSVIAYGISGPLADFVFVPLLVEGGTLAESVGKVIGVGKGRGFGFLIIVSGVLLATTASLLYRKQSVKELENGGSSCTRKS